MARASLVAEDGPAALDCCRIEGAQPFDAAVGGAAAARQLRPERR